MVVAVIALVVAFTGGAYAATVINGKNIKKSTITSKQVRDNSLTGTDIRNGSIKRADLDVDAFAAGPKGDKGESGVSILESSIPSGKTVKGVWSVSGSNQTAGPFPISTSVALPIPAPVALESSSVNFGEPPTGTNDLDPSCNGTIFVPTAPPGKACLYFTSMTTSGGTPTSSYGYGAAYGGETLGFEIWITLAATSVARASGVWAYTAP
jgi:hypothetical protein